jgi:nucleoid DNA-binding protein
MNKEELARKLAHSAQVTPAEAADQLDGVLHDILTKLRQGKPASLPGFGKLVPDAANRIRFTSTTQTSKQGKGGRK